MPKERVTMRKTLEILRLIWSFKKADVIQPEPEVSRKAPWIPQSTGQRQLAYPGLYQ